MKNRYRYHFMLYYFIIHTMGCHPWNFSTPPQASAHNMHTLNSPNKGVSPMTQSISTTHNERFQKPSKEHLKKKLSPMSYAVTQEDSTEPPFQNAYWNNHEEGLYVDITTGEPLFSSRDKYDSGTGWPSFFRALESSRLEEKTDYSHGRIRIEVRSRLGDAHLGHKFDDGPKPTGVRYCMNSASLRFIPVAQLLKEGYGEYLPLFSGQAMPTIQTPTPEACSLDAPQGPSCNTNLETIVLGGGCFWGMEDLLRDVPGILETEVGYAGGGLKNPTYNDVKKGTTGHAEVVRVVFDPQKISLQKLLTDWFFRIHDPTTKNRQGNDIGTQYRSVIFTENEEQKRIAKLSIQEAQKSGRWNAPIVTAVEDQTSFTRAEDYHQDYLEKNPDGYTCHFIRE